MTPHQPVQGLIKGGLRIPGQLGGFVRHALSAAGQRFGQGGNGAYEAFFPLLATAGIYFLLILIVTTLLPNIFFMIDNKNRKKARTLKEIVTDEKMNDGEQGTVSTDR